MSFSPNQSKLLLASASNDATVILWNLDLNDLQHRGCQWLDDYLKHNPNGKQYQDLCTAVTPQLTSHAPTLWEQTISFVAQLFKP